MAPAVTTPADVVTAVVPNTLMSHIILLPIPAPRETVPHCLPRGSRTPQRPHSRTFGTGHPERWVDRPASGPARPGHPGQRKGGCRAIWGMAPTPTRVGLGL